MTERLFYSYRLSDVIKNQEQTLANEINSLSEHEVLNTSQEDMVSYLIEKYRINPLEIDESGIQTDYGDVSTDVSKDPSRAIYDRSKPFYITGTHITFYVPFIGDLDLFKCRPSTFSLRPLMATVRSNEILFTYELVDGGRTDIGDIFNRDLRDTQDHVVRIATDVGRFNSSLPRDASNLIDARREKLLRDRNLVAKIGYPLRRAQDRPSTFITPDVKRRITPRKPAPSSTPFNPEPVLALDDYEHILSVLSNMVTVMEQSPRAFRGMDEEDLRTHFLVHLNGHYEGQATGETFNYEGKTDILIKADGKNIFIAECKFWRGSAGLTEALDQLLRYTTWRDTKTALLLFNRNKNMSAVLESVAQTARKHSGFKAEKGIKSETNFRYVFGHRDDANRKIIVTILVFDVPV